MFARSAIRALAAPSARFFSSSASRSTRIAVFGAASPIGQPLSMLLKLDPLVTSINFHDVQGVNDIFKDVGDIDGGAKLSASGTDYVGAVLNSEVVVICAGATNKPGMSQDDLFKANAPIVRDIASTVARVKPKAYVLVVSDPVNSLVPVVAATLEKAGVFDPKRLCGVTTLDVVRASNENTLYWLHYPSSSPVTVVGGHRGPTIVPVLSQRYKGRYIYDHEGDYNGYVKYIQNAYKKPANGAILSTASAVATFTNSLLRAMKGEKGIITPTFVKSPLYAKQGVDFFASKVELGVNGVEKILPVGDLDKQEQKLLDACLPELKKDIEKGKAFVA